MATKIRLQRHGKKGKPFYYIVVADSRAPRDGKFIERIGSYNPNTNPATIELNFEKAVDWITIGATPTDTTKAILSYKGVLYKKHLNGGIAKGALTTEQADEKFAAWLESKDGKIQTKKDGLLSKKELDKKTALEAETKKKEAVAAALAAKNAPVVEEEPVAETEEEVTAEEETPVAETPVEEVAVAEEASVAEAPVEEPKAEETPVEEPKAEEPKKETPTAE
ncbi:MAG: 30S ribosomal protein S16 [Pelobium sp.]